ncbi:hypothetical protein L3Q82_006333 [Scortum barcoo]|uniref:Uncharacterized protein n=1 Tax=Scortum barcoo TaxID=214431 RepID=A0ACB8WYZ1_9TELE|nr:hypothetical protein L3Q82_006333 [Scortum barcoo]
MEAQRSVKDCNSALLVPTLDLEILQVHQGQMQLQTVVQYSRIWSLLWSIGALDSSVMVVESIVIHDDFPVDLSSPIIAVTYKTLSFSGPWTSVDYTPGPRPALHPSHERQNAGPHAG